MAIQDVAQEIEKGAESAAHGQVPWVALSISNKPLLNVEIDVATSRFALQKREILTAKFDAIPWHYVSVSHNINIAHPV